MRDGVAGALYPCFDLNSGPYGSLNTTTGAFTPPSLGTPAAALASYVVQVPVATTGGNPPNGTNILNDVADRCHRVTRTHLTFASDNHVLARATSCARSLQAVSPFKPASIKRYRQDRIFVDCLISNLRPSV
jgi:hypothetical protein